MGGQCGCRAGHVPKMQAGMSRAGNSREATQGLKQGGCVFPAVSVEMSQPGSTRKRLQWSSEK